MTALGLVTVGYDLTGGYIGEGNFFGKDCFCGAFTMDLKQEPCFKFQTDILDAGAAMDECHLWTDVPT